LESVASIAAYHFYIDQPEVSLKFYKRLVSINNFKLIHKIELGL